MDWHFLFSALSIVLIDLILGGDNAVVIAFAVKALPRVERMRGIVVGALCAVLLRIAITFFAADLLAVRFLQLAGGILILWIAVGLFQDAAPKETAGRPITSFWRAVGYIVMADLTMSTDNILAIAATSKGNLALLVFGLGLSIPLVVCASTLLSRLMDHFPILVFVGAAVLGRVGAEMILTDAFVARTFHPSYWVRYVVEAAAAIAVVVTGGWRAHGQNHAISES